MSAGNKVLILIINILIFNLLVNSKIYPFYLNINNIDNE